MSDALPSTRILHRDALGEVRRWHLPDVECAPAVPEPAGPAESEPVPTPPTLEEIEAIEHAAHEEGYQNGFAAGQAEGHALGLAQGHEEGFRCGRDEGLRQGLQEGMAQAERRLHEQLAERRAQLDALLDALTRPLAGLDAEVEHELVQLTIAIAKRLIRRELKASPGEVVAVIRETLALLPASGIEVVLSLHPQDAQLVRGLGVLDSAPGSLRVVEDPTLERGGCRAQAGPAAIDATVEARINAVVAALLGGERDTDAEAHGERG